MFDLDGDGTISQQELKEVLSHDNNLTSNDIKQIMIEVDPNGDGEISYEEFVDLMLEEYGFWVD